MRSPQAGFWASAVAIRTPSRGRAFQRPRILVSPWSCPLSLSRPSSGGEVSQRPHPRVPTEHCFPHGRKGCASAVLQCLLEFLAHFQNWAFVFLLLSFSVSYTFCTPSL